MLTAFIVYLIVLLVAGVVATQRAKSKDDFLLAGRRLGPLAAGFSAAATSMSGWLFMGLPGRVLQIGFAGAWMGLSCILGDYANWKLVSTRLRNRSASLGALTLPEFVTSCRQDVLSKLTRVLAGSGVVFFMTIYLWAQFVATGKALSGSLETQLGYEAAVVVGAAVIILYTALGGFVAVVWTDVIQGLLIALALIGLPAYCVYLVITQGQTELLFSAPPIDRPQGSMGDLWGDAVGLGIAMVVVTSLGVGAGYVAQPQMAARFMALRDASDAKHARWIGVSWTALTAIGVIIIAMCAPVLLSEAPDDAEQVVLATARQHLPEWLSGIIIAALLAAVMSSADSFLIAAVSSIQQDFPGRLRTMAKSSTVSRFLVIGLGILATVLALRGPDSVRALVEYAWAGLSITFGVTTLYCLWVRTPYTGVVLVTMLFGIAMMTFWHLSGLVDDVYEVIPCLAAQSLICFVAHVMCSSRPSTA